jgi:phosphohistidine phosphatase SixA
MLTQCVAEGTCLAKTAPHVLQTTSLGEMDMLRLAEFGLRSSGTNSKRIPLLVVTMMSTLAAGAVQAQEEPPPGLRSVLGELRKGGFVVYFRHTTTDQAGASDEEANLARCETQRNLTAEGREQATRIGRAFRELGIPVEVVTSSPFCRCKDTARLAFRQFTVSDDLSFAMGAGADERKRLAGALRRMLSTPPPKGTNTVIVAHTANLREATGIWPKPEGVAYLFRPRREGQLVPVAKILPEEWAAAAEQKHVGASR